jgi:hypothetical protein
VQFEHGSAVHTVVKEIDSKERRLNRILATGALLLALVLPAGCSSSPQSLEPYEVVGTKMFNQARIVEVKSSAALPSLRRIAEKIVADEKTNGASIVRVFFYFPDEAVGQVLPRYRFEDSLSGIRVDDMTEQRKTAGLRTQ